MPSRPRKTFRQLAEETMTPEQIASARARADDEIRRMRESGAIPPAGTDLEALDALTDAEIDAQIAENPDAAEEADPAWFAAAKRIPASSAPDETTIVVTPENFGALLLESAEQALAISRGETPAATVVSYVGEYRGEATWDATAGVYRGRVNVEGHVVEYHAATLEALGRAIVEAVTRHRRPS